MKIISKYWLANNMTNKSNAIVGISIGWRNFSKKKIKAITKFALDNFDKVLILIVDSIKKYNWMAFDKMSEIEANNKAIREGTEYRKATESIINSLKNEKYDISKIVLKNWGEATNDIPLYDSVLNLLKETYIKDKIFRYDCLSMTEKYIETKWITDISITQKEIAVDFLLNELSLFLIIGISTENQYCIDIYPGNFPVIENILNWKYKWLLGKLPNNLKYGHIEIEQ